VEQVGIQTYHPPENLPSKPLGMRAKAVDKVIIYRFSLFGQPESKIERFFPKKVPGTFAVAKNLGPFCYRSTLKDRGRRHLED